MASKRVRVVAFDVGGVIAENMSWIRELRKFVEVKEEQVEAIEAVRKRQWNIIKTTRDYPIETFWREILQAGGYTEAQVTWQQLNESLRGGFRVFPSTLSVVEKLCEDGYTVGVISNHSTEWFKETMAHHNALDYFPNKDLVVVSCDVGVGKPHRGIFDVAWSRFVAVHPDLKPEEVIFIGILWRIFLFVRR
jgi:FMN phosphatase YigB (HAD superfamily)